MNRRALRAATIGALLVAPIAMSACSAGQVNQTSSQDRDKVGPRAEVGDLELRQVQLVNPCEGGDEDATSYERGDDPELLVTIVNEGREDDTLTGISGDLFDGVYVGEPPSATATTSAAPATSAAPSAGTSETPGAGETPESTETPSGSTAPESGVPAATSAAPTTAATPTPSTRLSIPVEAGTTTTIGLRQYTAGQPCDPEIAADTTRLFLADLSEDLAASQAITLTFTFADAGEVTVQGYVAGPAGAVERGEGYDFEQGEGGDQGDEQDTESE